jgi:UDP-2,3-diacylglucosamine hydrolase
MAVRRRTPRKTYFFSDVHLGLGSQAEDRAKEARIVSFLDHVKQDGSHLYIVGDLFDYWFEYDSVVPKGYVRLFGKLAELHDAGIGISYLAGNHDFWLKSYLTDELGIEVFPDPIERTIDGKRFLIHHGDGLLKRDTGYRLLKRILRNRFNIWLFGLLHPDLTGRIARWSSQTSRHYTSNKAFEGYDMIAFAEAQIDAGFNFVVMGHNHEPLYHPYGAGAYVNLGDWIQHNSYAVFDGTTLLLKTWKQSPGEKT